jgi:ABC-type nitrate/sulfonate/bicarbonate transport system substrate-binding protein
MEKSPVRRFIFLFLAVLGLSLGLPASARTTAAPVGQLPSVTVSVTPSIYALPIWMVEKAGEWKDFGIQIKVKVHSNGQEQLERAVANEWEVGVMDPLNAVKGGNEGDVAIVGIAGDFSSQIFLLASQGAGLSHSEKWAEWLSGYEAWKEAKGENPFLPGFLVATSSYADTRKTLVIRWLEGYSRGIQIIKKNPEAAAAQLKEFLGETLKEENPTGFIGQDIRRAFFFEDNDREHPFRRKEASPSLVEEFARSMTQYLKEVKALDTQAEPSDYILSKPCEQLSALRGEALSQLEKTRLAIDAEAEAGARVNALRAAWEESKTQIEEGRGCLTVIGVLYNLQRSADQALVDSARLIDFRRIELGVGVVLALYYVGYFLHRRKRA